MAGFWWWCFITIIRVKPFIRHFKNLTLINFTYCKCNLKIKDLDQESRRIIALVDFLPLYINCHYNPLTIGDFKRWEQFSPDWIFNLEERMFTEHKGIKSDSQRPHLQFRTSVTKKNKKNKKNNLQLKVSFWSSLWHQYRLLLIFFLFWDFLCCLIFYPS